MEFASIILNGNSISRSFLFKIKSQNTKFVLDPFDSKMVGIKLPLQEADFILVSHHHRDHDYVEAVRG